MQDKADNSETEPEKINHSKDDPLFCLEIKRLLAEAQIHHYEPEVITHLTDYSKFYVNNVLEQSLTFMKHAGRTNLSVEDVKLALDVVTRKVSDKRLKYKELVDLAQKHNKIELSNYCNKPGIPLPNNGCVLTKCNYKLKSEHSQLSTPKIETANSNQIITFNTVKNNGVTTVIRTSSGTMPLMPMSLAPQRIILKPQTNSLLLHQNKIKIEDLKK